MAVGRSGTKYKVKLVAFDDRARTNNTAYYYNQLLNVTDFFLGPCTNTCCICGLRMMVLKLMLIMLDVRRWHEPHGRSE